MYAFCQDMPGVTLEQQRILQRHIPAGATADCLAHVVGEIDGGVRMISVWSDEASYRAFQTTHLWPALDRAMREMPMQAGGGPADFTVLEVSGVSVDELVRG